MNLSSWYQSHELRCFENYLTSRCQSVYGSAQSVPQQMKSGVPQGIRTWSDFVFDLHQ